MRRFFRHEKTRVLRLTRLLWFNSPQSAAAAISNLQFSICNFQFRASNSGSARGAELKGKAVWGALELCLAQLTEYGCSAAEEVPSLRPPRGLFTPSLWEQHGALLITGIALTAGIAAFLIWRARRPKPVAVVPAVLAARQALQSLQASPQDSALALTVSRILRHYLITALGLPDAELTTAEFEVVLRDHSRIGVNLAMQLIRFLRDCDVRKFAPMAPKSDSELAAKALELINQVETSRTPEIAEKPSSP